MTTETRPLEEVFEASTNGTSHEDHAEPVVIVEPDQETIPKFGDPRDAVVAIVRDRLERMLQPVDDDEVWHGVNVITAKDLNAVAAEALPPASIFAASVRTPAYIYVDAVCPVCNIAGEILLTVDAELTAVRGSRKLQLAAKATALPHVCWQKRLELGGPTAPVAKGQTSLDLGDDVESDAGDADFGDGAPNEQADLALDADSDDGTSGEDPADVDRDAIHSLAGVKAPASDEPDDLSDLPF